MTTINIKFAPLACLTAKSSLFPGKRNKMTHIYDSSEIMRMLFMAGAEIHSELNKYAHYTRIYSFAKDLSEIKFRGKLHKSKFVKIFKKDIFIIHVYEQEDTRKIYFYWHYTDEYRLPEKLGGG